MRTPARTQALHFASHALFSAAPHIPTSLSGFDALLAERMSVSAAIAAARAASAAGGGAAAGEGEGEGEGGRAALITRFPAGSVAFLPILPFASAPSGTVSQMHGEGGGAPRQSRRRHLRLR